MKEKYFQWLIRLVCDSDSNIKYYRNLFRALHNREFTWINPMDENRAADGIDLRVRYADQHEISLGEELYPLDGPCTVLEMMVGLALRCEETIMGDIELGDRTGDWFWGMIDSLGLYQQDDYNFDSKKVENAIDKMLLRQYRRDGKGGLFTVPRVQMDLRDVEIWYQMLWYLDTLI